MYLSGVSSYFFFVFFFFSFCIAAVLQCWSLFAALIVFSWRVGRQHLLQAKAAHLIRGHFSRPGLFGQDKGTARPRN